MRDDNFAILLHACFAVLAISQSTRFFVACGVLSRCVYRSRPDRDQGLPFCGSIHFGCTAYAHTAYRPSRASLKRLTSVKAHGPTCHIGRTAVVRTGEQYTKSTETDSDTSRYKLELFLTTLPLVQTASGHQLGSVTSVCPSHRHRQKMPGAWMGWMGWCSSAGCGVCAGHYTVHDMRCTM